MSTKRVLHAAFLLLAAAGQAATGAVRGAVAVAPGGFADIVEKTLPGVVRVMTGTTASKGKVSGEGSGVVIRADGYLLTNRHVVEGSTKITVQMNDERELAAVVVASDAPTDLAVLKVEASGLHAIEFG